MWPRPEDSKKFSAQRALFRAARRNAVPPFTAASAHYSSCLSCSGFSFSSCRPQLGVVLWLFYLSLLFFSLFFFRVHLPILRLQSPRCNLPDYHVSRTWPTTHILTHSHKAKVMTAAGVERREGNTFVSHVPSGARTPSFFSIPYFHHPSTHVLMLLFIWNKTPKLGVT